MKREKGNGKGKRKFEWQTKRRDEVEIAKEKKIRRGKQNKRGKAKIKCDEKVIKSYGKG